MRTLAAPDQDRRAATEYRNIILKTRAMWHSFDWVSLIRVKHYVACQGDHIPTSDTSASGHMNRACSGNF